MQLATYSTDIRRTDQLYLRSSGHALLSVINTIGRVTSNSVNQAQLATRPEDSGRFVLQLTRSGANMRSKVKGQGH